MRLRELYDRVETCRQKYWDLPKDLRIEHGLREDAGGYGYSGARVVERVLSATLHEIAEAVW
jgi:hypothetical protein